MQRSAQLRALSMVVLATGLAACAGHHRRQQESLQFQEEPVATLYNEGANYLDQKRWQDAVHSFQEVERQHPYSSWARRSMLMEAYANYQANKYDDAIEDAQRFLELHPGNENAPYAYYLISICQFERILDVGRDQATTEHALQALQDVVRRYPDTPYARDATLKIDMVYDQLAGKEMAVGRFYLLHDQHLAAINRFRNVVENPNYQRTSHVPEALHRLVEAYLSIGMTDEAQRMAAILGHNFPGSVWYQRSYALMTAHNVAVVPEDEAQRRGWFSRTFGTVFGRS
ncbi:MAG: outer membrane protein assembly factor BamD [Pseudomonadota bacterium]